jgi:type II secretory pathway pseudopilin PulG
MMKMRRQEGTTLGYTLVELLAAALVFSIVGMAMGAYYVFSVQRVEDGHARAALLRNGTLIRQAVEWTLRSGVQIAIPAEGELAGQGSITVRFPPEPFLDDNLNNQYDAHGAQGACAPMECFNDLNGNGIWDEEVRPARSFRRHQERLEVRDGNSGASWDRYLDDRYPGSAISSVRMKSLTFLPDEENPDFIRVRFVITDDMRTPEFEEDDLRQAFELVVQKQG